MQATQPSDQRTRERLLERLRELRRGASTRELAQHFDLHVNGVRRHLDQLAAAGVLTRRKARGGRGRPHDEWSLAPGARPGGEAPRRYLDLSRWLCRAVESGSRELNEIEREGYEIGRDLAPLDGEPAPIRFREALTALGFDPVLEPGPGGTVRCRLCNCPYLDAARQSPEVVCTLHRGITAGLVEALDPGARLESWQARDPAEAGCVADIAGASWELAR